jgi:hypothetical protein
MKKLCKDFNEIFYDSRKKLVCWRQHNDFSDFTDECKKKYNICVCCGDVVSGKCRRLCKFILNNEMCNECSKIKSFRYEPSDDYCADIIAYLNANRKLISAIRLKICELIAKSLIFNNNRISRYGLDSICIICGIIFEGYDEYYLYAHDCIICFDCENRAQLAKKAIISREIFTRMAITRLPLIADIRGLLRDIMDMFILLQ